MGTQELDVNGYPGMATNSFNNPRQQHSETNIITIVTFVRIYANIT